MLNPSKVRKALIRYFEQKGRVLSAQEYSRETDTPVRIYEIKEVFGSWKRMENIIMADKKATASNGLNVNALIKARNEAESEAAKQWRDASENQDAKAYREAEAQVVAEVLARNAATPEGANANKIAIGGKLPGEQQDYSAMGATVEKDPITGEQTIIDTKPEVPTTTVEDARTPQELRDAVAAEKAVATGSAPVDKSTADGSTGQASTSTVDALGADTVDAGKIADKTSTNTTSTENTKVPADETKGTSTKK